MDSGSPASPAALVLPTHVELPLVLGRPAPHPVQLMRRQRVLQALAAHLATSADRLRPGYLTGPRPMRRDGKEQLRISLLTGSRSPPVAPFCLERGALGWQLGNNHAQTPRITPVLESLVTLRCTSVTLPTPVTYMVMWLRGRALAYLCGDNYRHNRTLSPVDIGPTQDAPART
jgi:hypothetical protein